MWGWWVCAWGWHHFNPRCDKMNRKLKSETGPIALGHMKLRELWMVHRFSVPSENNVLTCNTPPPHFVEHRHQTAHTRAHQVHKDCQRNDFVLCYIDAVWECATATGFLFTKEQTGAIWHFNRLWVNTAAVTQTCTPMNAAVWQKTCSRKHWKSGKKQKNSLFTDYHCIHFKCGHALNDY